MAKLSSPAVPGIELLPFADEHLDASATLLAHRHALHLLSSRFWPRRGFRETFLRLHRAVVPG
jgi:hypothetical protein